MARPFGLAIDSELDAGTDSKTRAIVVVVELEAGVFCADLNLIIDEQIPAEPELDGVVAGRACRLKIRRPTVRGDHRNTRRLHLVEPPPQESAESCTSLRDSAADPSPVGIGEFYVNFARVRVCERAPKV